MPQCVGIKNDGLQCTARSGVEREHGGIRCAVHWRILAETINIHGVEDGLVIHEAREGRLVMDGPAVRERAGWARVAEHNRRLARVEAAYARRMGQGVAEAGRNARVPVGRLERIANDNQNVHTTEAVNQTKEIVKKVLAIPVPMEYQWNVYWVSKTPGEIITDCMLQINPARIMMDKYTLSDDIYEMGPGIYGKVLDGVWQYIKNSKDKKDLCKILAQELKDNVGMCLQGNLSRLCNVLAGYMENIGSQESIAEILGREFAIISQIADYDERFAKANKILDDNEVTDAEIREAWISAL
jgi:hypothetical protein